MLKDKILKILNNLFKQASIRNMKVKYVYQKMIHKLKEYKDIITSIDNISFIGSKTKEIIKKEINELNEQNIQGEFIEEKRIKRDTSKLFSSLLSESDSSFKIKESLSLINESNLSKNELSLTLKTTPSLLIEDCSVDKSVIEVKEYSKSDSILIIDSPIIKSKSENYEMIQSESFINHSLNNNSLNLSNEKSLIYNDKNNASSISDKPVTKKKKLSKRNQHYIPMFRSGAYAILKVLSEEDGLNKNQISVRGKKYCDCEFDTKIKYSAFSSIKTLIKKKLIHSEGKPVRYYLTDEGKEISQRLPSGEVKENNEKVVKLLIDSREMKDKRSRNYFQNELDNRRIPVETCNLEIGDFVWVYDGYVLDVVIERKKGTDFVSSINDGRLKEQMERLKCSGIKRIFYLIEDLKCNNENEYFIKSTLSDMKKKEITVIETESIKETIEFIIKLNEFINKNELNRTCLYEEFISKNVKNVNLNENTFFMSAILSIKGMNKEKAKLLANKYKNITQFINYINQNTFKEKECDVLFFMSHKQFLFLCKILGINK